MDRREFLLDVLHLAEFALELPLPVLERRANHAHVEDGVEVLLERNLHLLSQEPGELVHQRHQEEAVELELHRLHHVLANARVNLPHEQIHDVQRHVLHLAVPQRVVHERHHVLADVPTPSLAAISAPDSGRFVARRCVHRSSRTARVALVDVVARARAWTTARASPSVVAMAVAPLGASRSSSSYVVEVEIVSVAIDAVASVAAPPTRGSLARSEAGLVAAVQRPGDEAGGGLQVLAALLLARLHLLVDELGEARADALEERLVAGEDAPSFWSRYIATGSSRLAMCASLNPSWCT